ncbi:hypothetical protein HanPSC8_Chr10g0433491 [Helianthus annuus]|nr:hypothetical protein HanPSC8_Chr10g0433491 [Helianthus annuus]
MIYLFPVDKVCPVCHKACLDSFGAHAVHCRELPGSNTDMIWFGMSFLIYSGALVFLLRKMHPLISFDTFGFLAPEAVDLLSRVQRVMHSNVMTPRSMDVVFKRFSFAIQKEVVAQLFAHLLSISM